MACKLRPYERSRCTEHIWDIEVESYKRYVERCARPTGDSYGLTTEAHEQRFNGTNLTATLEVG